MPSPWLVPIKAHVSPQKKAELQELAARTNISLSTLIRRLIAGRQPPDLTQQQDSMELVKLRADLARLGNLFKMALDNEEFHITFSNRGRNAQDLMEEISATKDLVNQAIKKRL